MSGRSREAQRAPDPPLRLETRSGPEPDAFELDGSSRAVLLIKARRAQTRVGANYHTIPLPRDALALQRFSAP